MTEIRDLTTDQLLARFLDLAEATSRLNCESHLADEQEAIRLELIRRSA